MITGAEFLAVLAIIAGGQDALPRNYLIQTNNEFARKVDAGENCFFRIGGEVGEYGKPENYTWYPLCNRVKPMGD